jgi:hypothetical protein
MRERALTEVHSSNLTRRYALETLEHSVKDLEPNIEPNVSRSQVPPPPQYLRCVGAPRTLFVILSEAKDLRLRRLTSSTFRAEAAASKMLLLNRNESN